MGEYLYTGKPLMFVVSNESLMNHNEFAKACFEQHYVGRNLQDLEAFFIDVVLDGKDSMKDQRMDFVMKELMGSSTKAISQRIYEEMIKDLS